MWFRAAHHALDLPEAGDEEAGMTDGQLIARVVGYQRERAWAPRWVEDDLAATHEQRQRRDTDATLWEARANAPDITAEDAAQLRADAAAARAEAEQLAEQIRDLEQVDTAWAAWYADTAVSRDRHDRSRHELRSRGVDVDNPPDRTTAADWHAAHQTAQAEQERYADIGEHDVHDTDTQLGEVGRRDRLDVVEANVADIRETAVPEPTETADPAVRRRVLPLDETVQAVAKAQDALAEVKARRAAEAAQAADEAAREAELEVERREQLNRWDDTATDTEFDVTRTHEDADVPLDEALTRD